MKTNDLPQGARKTEGSVLIIAMVILIVLTVIGMASIGTSNMETQISVNDLDYKINFYCSESSMNIMAEILRAMNKGEMLDPPDTKTASIKANLDYPASDPDGEQFNDAVYKYKIGVTALDGQADITVILQDCGWRPDTEGLAEIDMLRGATFVAEGGAVEFGSGQGGSESSDSSNFAPYDLAGTYKQKNNPDVQYRIATGTYIKIE